MKYLFLEPFYGGSHRDFADGLIGASSHQIDLLTLPARFWKWRMRGAALYFIKKIKNLDTYDGLILSDLMSLADFKALCPEKCPPTLVYFHENQLTYPLAPGEVMDYQYGFTNITTALCAQKILFNSNTHYDLFFNTLPEFLKMMPEFVPTWAIKEIKSKSAILHPGCCFDTEVKFPLKNDYPLLIVWNHRWEFDKNPEAFFNALEKVQSLGRKFRLVLLGERYRKYPAAFKKGLEQFEPCIVYNGYSKTKSEYYAWLKKSAIVISTACQENFGIAMVEAIRYGCIPLVPDRLAYPEILAKAFHKDCIYQDQADLVDKLCQVLDDYPGYFTKTESLAHEMDRFAWKYRIELFDQALTELAQYRSSIKG